ncbi:MAG TPA: 50S ribosomal protein L11 methyltransferase [Gaiellaceae bacterium]|nr:50S ribosomal protein L11 methyltransferase [Gaiellaceae bacterium]
MNELRRVSVRVPPELAEEARARLLELVPEGFEEIEVDGAVELAVYLGAAGELQLRDALGRELESAPVPPGWEHRWRSFHRPVVAGGVWIGPPWEPVPAGLPAVVIDPGLAFGTGAHPTTRLCVELLAGLEGGSLLDVGSGSGVLAIAARRLGFDPVAAVDVDPVAVEVTCANAAANGVDVDVRLADASTEALPAADVVVANIALPAVEDTLDRAEAGLAVTSGYLVGERPESPGWRPRARRGLDGWAADLLERD